MKKQNKTILALGIITAFLTAGLFVPVVVGAGDLEPTDPPGPTMKTLDEVEPRIPISNLPFTIDKPGSYYLTGDLTAGGTGITVTADNVTIDLMGYTISGGGSYNGIYMDGRSNVEIRNGTIQGFVNNGITESSNSGEGHRVIHVRVISNGYYGIHLYSRGNLIKDCTAVRNGGYGIRVYTGSTVTNNTAYGNGSHGIYARTGGTVTNNTAYGNGSHGIYTEGYSTVTNNTVYHNGSDGIFVGSGSTVTNNTAYHNGSDGIYVSFCCTVINNTAYGNDEHGIYTSGDGNTVIGNTARHNEFHGISVKNGLVDGNTATSNNDSGGSYVNLYCSGCTLGTNHAP